MTDPYSDDRNADNPFAYYEEEELAPVPAIDEEPPANMEPRTPFSLTMRRIRSFQMANNVYRLIVLHDHCEVTIDGRASDIMVMRCDAPECVRVRGNKITLITETRKRFHFAHELDDLAALKRARLQFWSRNESATDPMAAYHAVQEIRIKDFFQGFFRSLLYMIIAVAFAFLVFGSASYVNRHTGEAVFFILLSYLLFYIAYDVLLYWNRKLILSRIVMFLPPLFAVLVLIGAILFGHGLFAAILGGIPAFWFFVMILAFRGSLRQLRTDNAGIFVWKGEPPVFP